MDWKACIALVACGVAQAVVAADVAPRTVPFVVPAPQTIPDGPLGDAVRQGLSIVNATRVALPGNVGNALNCASCHNFTGRGGALSSGKSAPHLDGVTEDQLYTAMLTGPENMPKFSDRQLSPDETKDIIAYVKSVTDGNNNPGGNALGGFGPGTEGLIAWIIGLAALIGVTVWMGSKA